MHIARLIHLCHFVHCLNAPLTHSPDLSVRLKLQGCDLMCSYLVFPGLVSCSNVIKSVLCAFQTSHENSARQARTVPKLPKHHQTPKSPTPPHSHTPSYSVSTPRVAMVFALPIYVLWRIFLQVRNLLLDSSSPTFQETTLEMTRKTLVHQVFVARPMLFLQFDVITAVSAHLPLWVAQ